MLLFVHICQWSGGNTLIFEQQNQKTAMQLVQFTKLSWPSVTELLFQHINFSQPKEFSDTVLTVSIQ